MRIYVLVALARFMQETEEKFGAKALALCSEPERVMVRFQEYGDCEAYHIAPENQLNAIQSAPFWTPVHRWWVLDFDAPQTFPLVMYEAETPGSKHVPGFAQNAVPHERNGSQNGSRWWEDPAHWSEGQKRLLKIMMDNPAEMDTGIGKLGKRVGIGTQQVTAVKDAIREDKRLLNGLGQRILGGQS